MDPWAENFENGVGTYLKVVRFHSPTNPDGFVLLYLRPRGRFLFLGYWCGFERTLAAGRWSRQESEIHLEGRGTLCTDALPGPPGGRFERVFTFREEHSTPTLIATTELMGWSLLGWLGPLAYVGQRTVIDPDGEWRPWLPRSISEVDAWIEERLSD